MAERESQRSQGVNLDDVDAVTEAVDFPVTDDELVGDLGDRTIERTNADPITLRELFEPVEDQTFETPDDLRQFLLSLMPADSVGREDYSDRGGELPEESREARAADEEESV